MKALTPADEAILRAVENIVDGIAATYGSSTEVVLQRLDIKNPCIMKIANPQVTGRKVGAPITNLALSKLALKEDISAPYYTKSPQGKNLRSTTTVIRNPEGEAIGMLCINTNLDAPFQEVMKSFVPPVFVQQEELPPLVETFAHTTEEMVNSTIESTHQAVLKDKNISNGKKARTLVNQLFDLGIFNFKDAPKLVAQLTGISIHTIYRHLRDCHKGEN